MVSGLAGWLLLLRPPLWVLLLLRPLLLLLRPPLPLLLLLRPPLPLLLRPAAPLRRQRQHRRRCGVRELRTCRCWQLHVL